MARTRVANGSAALLAADGRSLWARRYKEVLASHVSDKGGDSEVTAAELAILRRAAAITVECERMEAEFASAGQADPKALDLHQRASGSLRRLLESVGLERRAKAVNSDLGTYLEGKAR
ncbi:hypothetical protein [Glycocaulis sp.]|jgi:hypothetical protein|uniref:hypothetical protein n=1 Tax=Glycocaulis sp. TaxID=1969725 RepID=UPI003D21B335